MGKSTKNMSTQSYNPDGTREEILSFYDKKVGETAKIKILQEATVKCASKSRDFLKDLVHSKKKSTYSNQNIDFMQIEPTVNSNIKSSRWRQ